MIQKPVYCILDVDKTSLGYEKINILTKTQSGFTFLTKIGSLLILSVILLTFLKFCTQSTNECQPSNTKSSQIPGLDLLLSLYAYYYCIAFEL